MRGTRSLRVDPCHPLVGRELEVLTDQRESVTVCGCDGVDLKVPKWMLSPAARVELSTQAVIGVQALLAVVRLIANPRDPLTGAAGEGLAAPSGCNPSLSDDSGSRLFKFQ